ncbi:MAG: AsmA family protein [Rhodospirillales bacterium]|nr:AsmA family protein [Rhodospirillales bacterium]
MGRSALRALGVVLAIVAAVVALAVTAVVVVSVFVGWNALKDPLASAVSGALGRNFAINGDLDVDLGRVTRIRMSGVTLENAEWAKDPANMVEIGSLDVGIDLLRLLSGDIVIDPLRIDKPKVYLTKDKNGDANWQFGKPQQDQQPTSRKNLPIVREIAISDGVLAYKDAKSGNDIDLTLASLQGGSDDQGVRVTADGTYQRQKLAVKASAGALGKLRNEGEPYPVDVDVAVGGLKATAKGTVAKPQTFEGLDIDLSVKGQNLANIYAIAGVPAPPSPPYSLKGHLSHDGTRWRFADFAGALGGSDLRGTASVDTSGGRLKADADLSSKLLDFDDIGVLVGGKRDEEKKADEQAKKEDRPRDDDGKVLPRKPIDLSKLREMDANVKFRAGQIRAPGLPVDDLNADITLDKGVLRFKPAALKLADGSVRLYLTLDGSVQPAGVDIDARVSQVDLKKLMRGTGFAKESAGTLGGHAELSAKGNSVAEILGSANGGMFMVMAGGTISHLLVELAGLDIAQSLGVAVSGDEPIPIRCVVADLKAQDGLFKVNSMVFDTSDTKIVGGGTINMSDEKLDLRLTPYPKDFSPLSVRTALTVQGTFKNPQAFPDPADLGVEGVAKKVVNAILTPIAGLLPPIDEGVGKDSDCGALIAQAKQAAQ